MSSVRAYPFAALALLTSACGDASDETGSMDAGSPNQQVLEGPFELSVSSTVVDFSPVRVTSDSGAERIVILRNAGGEPIESLAAIEGAEFESAFSFALSEDSLQPGESTNLTINFRPRTPGGFESTVILQASGGGTMTSTGLDLRGNGIRAAIEADRDDLDFGAAPLGSQTLLSFSIRNNGSGRRRVELEFSTNVSVCGPMGATAFCVAEPAGDFAADPSVEIEPQASQRFDVFFEPDVAGEVLGSIGYTCDLPDCGGELSLRGSTMMVGPGGP